MSKSYPGPKYFSRYILPPLSVIVFHLLFVVCTYFDLPDSIPVHFGSNGLADRAEPATFLTWSTLWLVSFIITSVLYSSAILIFTLPDKYISAGSKAGFEKLNRDSKKRILSTISVSILVITTLSAAIMWAVHACVLGVITDFFTVFPNEIIWITGMLLTVDVFISILIIDRRVKEEIEKNRNEE